jgi:exopolyphosphatase/guanosine-5'-triphosphate,3'-diphosphate pyrophosphatase
MPRDLSERRWRATRTGNKVLTALFLLMVLPANARAVSQPAAPVCAIDMGSNTFRRIVGTFANDRYDQRSIEKKTLGVGDDVARNGKISDQKLTEIEQTLAGFRTACEKEGAARIVAVGTSAFREAANGVRARAIADRLGIAMEIASEERESELAYLVGSLGQDGIAVIDNGSRSIELVAREDGARRHVVFNLGYRIAYETFFAAAADFQTASRMFQHRLEREAQAAPFMRNKKKLVGVEFGDLMDVLFEPGPLEGRVLTVAELKRKIEEIARSGPTGWLALKAKPDIDRALPRLVAAAFLTERFGYSQLELTERELGAGLIIEAGLKGR